MARVKRYQDGHIHLQYRGHPYTLSQVTSLKPIISYDTGQTTHITYEEGVANINLSGDSQPQPVLSDDETTLHVLGVAMAQQLSLKAGLRQFGDRGKKAVTKELTQLHKKVAYVPVDPESLSAEQKNEAMRSIRPPTEKRDGSIKAREVADGSSQQRRPGYKKEDSASPTVAT